MRHTIRVGCSLPGALYQAVEIVRQRWTNRDMHNWSIAAVLTVLIAHGIEREGRDLLEEAREAERKSHQK